MPTANNLTGISAGVQMLVVDDDPSIATLVVRTLAREGYACRIAESAVQTLKILGKEQIDIVLSDIMMPGMNGVELLKRITQGYSADVMIMTGFTEDYNYESLVKAGASDFISKPFSHRELLLRIKRVLQVRYLLIERDQTNEALEDGIYRFEKANTELNAALGELKAMNQELNRSYLDTINRLCLAAEYKDDDTGDHIIRISRYSELLAEKLGQSGESVQLIGYASPMHDIGKIGIPDNILLKPGKLTNEEFEIIKTHTTIGANILSGSNAAVLKVAHEIALNHHEKWNGRGYPNGLKKRDIPLSARIVGIVDTFDALTSRRPYKDPYPMEVAVEIIRSERGAHFDPEIVDVFITAIDEIRLIRDEINMKAQCSVSNFLWSDRDLESGLCDNFEVKQAAGGK